MAVDLGHGQPVLPIKRFLADPATHGATALAALLVALITLFAPRDEPARVVAPGPSCCACVAPATPPPRWT